MSIVGKLGGIEGQQTISEVLTPGGGSGESGNSVNVIVCTVSYDGNDDSFTVDEISHTYEEVKKLVDDNSPVMAYVIDMDGDSIADKLGLAYTSTYGTPDYSLEFSSALHMISNGNFEIDTLFLTGDGPFFSKNYYSMSSAT